MEYRTREGRSKADKNLKLDVQDKDDDTLSVIVNGVEVDTIKLNGRTRKQAIKDYMRE